MSSYVAILNDLTKQKVHDRLKRKAERGEIIYKKVFVYDTANASGCIASDSSNQETYEKIRDIRNYIAIEHGAKDGDHIRCKNFEELKTINKEIKLVAGYTLGILDMQVKYMIFQLGQKIKYTDKELNEAEAKWKEYCFRAAVKRYKAFAARLSPGNIERLYGEARDRAATVQDKLNDENQKAVWIDIDYLIQNGEDKAFKELRKANEDKKLHGNQIDESWELLEVWAKDLNVKFEREKT